MATLYFTLSLTEEEKKELIELLKDNDKWLSKIRESKGYFGVNWINTDFNLNHGFRSPGIPAWAKPLPANLDIGKRAKIVRGCSWLGWEGKIESHYICADDCAGSYGLHKYQILKDNGERFSTLAENCDLI